MRRQKFRRCGDIFLEDFPGLGDIFHRRIIRVQNFLVVFFLIAIVVEKFPVRFQE